LSADGALFFSFAKGKNDLTFLYLKEKLQKKQTNMLLDCRRAWKPYTAKPGGLCANACSGAELFACRKRGGFRTPLGSLGDFDHMDAFLLLRKWDGYSPKSRFYSLGACTAVPSSVVLRDFVQKPIGG
jgi:hypothetical protein